MDSLPKVTVIIPTYNYAGFIGHAIESIISQSYPADKVEILIIDDGSQDNTIEIVNGFSLLNLQYHYQKNKGKAEATATGISMASGKYIFNLDADDYFLPGKIKSTVEIFENNPDVVHVGNPAKCIYEDSDQYYIEDIPSFLLDTKSSGNEVLKYFYKNKMLFGGGSTFAARADVLKEINIPEQVDMYIDEYLILATLIHGDTYFVSSPLSVWRIHGNNYSGPPSSEKLKRLLKSSEAVYQLINKGDFPKWLQSLYKLNHYNRLMSFKEQEHSKSITDIVDFFVLLRKERYTFNTLKAYAAINRLFPTPLLQKLKVITNRRK